jgi:hypothetical protein
MENQLFSNNEQTVGMEAQPEFQPRSVSAEALSKFDGNLGGGRRDLPGAPGNRRCGRVHSFRFSRE